MTLEIPSIGRPCSLGMLYDAHEDMLIPGITLWRKEDLAKDTSTMPKDTTDFEVMTSDSVSDKSSALNISGELKISLWSGMINVEGSGKYLTDAKESKEQARVTLKYMRTTRFEQLTMNHLSHENITFKEVFDKGSATHVVTGILYGAHAFFVFDQKVTNSENVKDVQGGLQGMVTKIGQLTGKVTMNDTEKELSRQFSCKFYGDFALEKNPATYEEAVKIYQSLPKLLGENGEKAVPMKIWLYPLKDLDPRAARLVREISDYLVFTAEENMQQMSEVFMECNDLMRHPSAITFPALANKIHQFKKCFERYRFRYQKQLSQVLPSVRRGDAEESHLDEIVTRTEESPFSEKNIRKFLDRRWLEMEVVHALLKNLDGIRIVTDQRELTRAILHEMHRSTICFNFNLAYEDCYLSHLESWLRREPWDFQDIFTDNKNKEWFEDDMLLIQARPAVNEFYSRSQRNDVDTYLVTSVVCKDGPGLTLHVYKHGIMTPQSCSRGCLSR